MLEALYTQKVKAELSKYFEMNPEVWDYTMKSRIDYVATCKESGAAFGIEVKKTDYKRGEDIGNLIKQAMRYSQCEFPIKDGSYTKIPIFIVPQLSYDILHWQDETIIVDGNAYHSDRHNREHDHHGVNGILGALGIGEIRTFKACGNRKASFEFKFSNKTIWSSRPSFNGGLVRGLNKVNYDYLISKL